MIGKKGKSNKAQSQIVTAVLLILIVISLAIIILNFTIPFVKEQLSGTGCLDVVGQVEFSNNPKYTCFDSENEEILLQVSIGDVNDTLSGFLIELGGASTKSIQIKDGNVDEDGVKMFGQQDNETLELPGRNEERTYVFEGGFPDTVKIYPLLIDGKVCEATDFINSLDLCET